MKFPVACSLLSVLLYVTVLFKLSVAIRPDQPKPNTNAGVQARTGCNGSEPRGPQAARGNNASVPARIRERRPELQPAAFHPGRRYLLDAAVPGLGTQQSASLDGDEMTGGKIKPLAEVAPGFGTQQPASLDGDEMAGGKRNLLDDDGIGHGTQQPMSIDGDEMSEGGAAEGLSGTVRGLKKQPVRSHRIASR